MTKLEKAINDLMQTIKDSKATKTTKKNKKAKKSGKKVKDSKKNKKATKKGKKGKEVTPSQSRRGLRKQILEAIKEENRKKVAKLYGIYTDTFGKTIRDAERFLVPVKIKVVDDTPKKAKGKKASKPKADKKLTGKKAKKAEVLEALNVALNAKGKARSKAQKAFFKVYNQFFELYGKGIREAEQYIKLTADHDYPTAEQMPKGKSKKTSKKTKKNRKNRKAKKSMSIPQIKKAIGKLIRSMNKELNAIGKRKEQLEADILEANSLMEIVEN